MKIDKNIIKELTDYLNEFNLTEIEYTEKDTKIKVSKSTTSASNQIINPSSLSSSAKLTSKDISETVLWPKLCDRIERYRPFLHYNITKYRITLRNKLKELQ